MLYQKEIDDSVLIQFIILYTLLHVDEPVRYKDLVSLVLENCNINFNDFQISLDNLIQTGHVRIFNEGPDVKKYEITPKGIGIEDFLRTMVPIYIKEPIDESIKQLYIDKRRAEAVKANITPLRKNEYTADFELLDEDRIMLMNMSLYAGSRGEAEKLAKYFKAHAGEIYEKIIEIFAPADKEFPDDTDF
ncbi:MAG: DUF4364 family protein [Clostridiales bacterium]|nr:DUF4364 family protein [Clostridiales bacterium]